MPFYYCHGLLPVPGGKRVANEQASVDKLVFSESEYLQLVNSAVSWQSSVFLGTAVTRSLVFVGMSFSDGNLRRWLASTHKVRSDELREMQQWEGDSTFHLWIHKRPSSRAEQEWAESSVSHLGVRLVWLDDWAQLGEALRTMLSLRPAPSRTVFGDTRDRAEVARS